MTLKRLMLAAAIFLIAPMVACGQPYYPAYPVPQPAAAPTPPSWSYDPYTSGSAPCPQGIPGDLQTCRQRMPPTYGQPSFWPQR